jgi:hypothetical protein
MLRAFRLSRRHDQNGSNEVAQALRKVVTQYSSRSRSNFSCVALKLATRAAISARSFASRSRCCSVRPIARSPRIFHRPGSIGALDWGAIAETVVRDCDVHMSLNIFAVENLHRCENFSPPVCVVDKPRLVVESDVPPE